MLNIEDSLFFWSVIVLLGLIFFIFAGGLWISVRSFFSRRATAGALPEAPTSGFAVPAEERAPEPAANAACLRADPQPQYLRRTRHRRPV